MEFGTLTGDYSVSRIIHGGWQFSEGHRLSGEAIDSTVDVLMASAELGVTAFDCADIYTGVEELYGRFLKKWASTSTACPLQVHTKFVPDYDALEQLDRSYVHDIIHRSLTRLGIERLDLVQFYLWRDDVPGAEDAVEYLSDLRDAGKIRHLAVTNLDVERIERMQDAGGRLVSNQIQYSLLDRRAEGALTTYAVQKDMGLLCFGTLAGGFLTDRWLGALDPDASTNRSLVKYRLIIDEFGGWDALQALLRTLREVADGHETDIASVALRFVLDQRAVAAVIVGATRLGQMERNLGAFGFALTARDNDRIRGLIDAAPGPSGPVFGLERDRDGRHGRIMHYDLNAEGV